MNDNTYQTLSDTDSYQQARKRVRELRKYYTSIASFFGVNALLYGINFVTSGGITWAYWVTFGWGIGMLFYSVQVFFVGGKFWDDWENRQIEKMLNKDQDKK